MLVQLEARIKNILQLIDESVIHHHNLKGALEEAKTIYDMYRAAEEAKAKDDAQQGQQPDNS
jgi:hypothetical protein